ncbi:MAG TPA: MFS transporter [Candidatus Tumulicola sp.]|nr:MFS transporter [Candidatus Tumulicola sp.]
MASTILSASNAARHPLRSPAFRLLWIGRTVSNLGDQFYLVALPWLVLQLTNSSLALGTIMMTATIPVAVLMLVGGAVSDRFSARKIWMLTTSARTLSVTLVGLLVWFHALQLWHVYVLALLFGVADAFAAPAAQTFLPSLVDREQLPAANSVTQMTQQLTTILGPAPAGLVIRAFGVAWAFFIDAFSFLFVMAALWRLPDPQRSQTAAKKGLLHSIAEGLHYINSDAALRSLLILAAALNFCLSGPISIGLAWIAKQNFASPVAFSIFVSAVALGSLIGAALAGLYKPRRRGVTMIVVSALIALFTGLLGLLAHAWLLAVVLLAMGAAAGFLNVHIIAWFQQRVEREMLGRATSVLMFAAVGLAPVSLLLAGLAVKWNLTAMFVSSAVLMFLAAAVAALTKPVREIQ